MHIPPATKYILRDNPNIIEAGASLGEDIMSFSNLFPKGTIYSFEPEPQAFAHTYNLVKNIPNIHFYNLALGEKTGDVLEMHVSDRFGGMWGSSSLFPPKEHLNYHPDLTFKSTTKVKVVNLDDFISDKQIDFIDLLELDLQGYEPNVIKSSPKTLRKTKYLYTEVNLVELYEGIMLYPELRSLLENNGFEVIEEDLPWADAGNVLFKNKNF